MKIYSEQILVGLQTKTDFFEKHGGTLGFLALSIQHLS